MRRSDQLEKIRSDYRFLRDRALDGQPFEMANLIQASGRKVTEATIHTYRSKKYGQFLVPSGDGKYVARKDFLNVRFHEFVPLFRQAEKLYADYDLFVHGTVQVFEFF